MKPIFFGIGITAALTGSALLMIAPHLDFLSPYWGTILRMYGPDLVLHAAALALTSVVVFYRLARVLGLADLGRRVDLAERGIRPRLRRYRIASGSTTWRRRCVFRLTTF